MQFELVYDAATMSEAPGSALLLALCAVVAVAVWSAWLKGNGRPLGMGVKFLGSVAVILFLLSAGSFYEQSTLAKRTDVRTVEGPVTGLWTRQVRRGGKTIAFWEWEGFSVGGVNFSYARNLEQNYFHNGGSTAIDLRDGMVLRLRYIEERDGSPIRNQILRLERQAGN